MGYVNDTHMSIFIPPGDFEFSEGTWTVQSGSNIIIRQRSADDAAFAALIPIRLMGNSSYRKGCRLEEIKVWYRIEGVEADDFENVNLIKNTVGPDDVSVQAATIPISLDAGHDSAAKRKALDDDHCMTVTLTTPVWVSEDDIYYLYLTIDCHADSVVTFVAARANFTLRV